ncbi:hypothetical protein JTB14_020351 [Gonioctena quinquepunctata]|nr:hypothetical protein JTB14_020351 [Gonioctena quinquepunctata]
MIFSENDLSTIVAGEFNAKHTTWSIVSNRNGNKLRRHCDGADYVIAVPNEPTFYGPYRPDVLDIVLNKNLHWDIDVTTLQELSSVHNPMKIEFGKVTKLRIGDDFHKSPKLSTAVRKIFLLPPNSTLL